MATKNTPTTPVEEDQNNQIEGGQVNNPELSRREFIKTAIIAGTSLKLENALAFLLPNEAKAGGNTPEELAKQEEAIIEANGGIMNTLDLKGHLTKLEVKNPNEVLKMYEGIEDLDKSIVGKYINVGLISTKNERLGNGVLNFITGFNNKKIYTAFLQKPNPDNVPTGTTTINFVIASKGFTGADLIITKEMLNEIKGLDKEMVRVRTEVLNKRIATADEEIATADEEIATADEEIATALKNQESIKRVKVLTDEIIDMSKNIKKAAGT